MVTVIWFTGSYTRPTLHHLARVSANWHRIQHLPFRPLVSVLLQPLFHSAWSSLCPVSESQYPTPNKYPHPLPQTLVIKNLSLGLLLWAFHRVGLIWCAICTCSFVGQRLPRHIHATVSFVPHPFRSPQSPPLYQRPPCCPPTTKAAPDVSAFVIVSTAAVNIRV